MHSLSQNLTIHSQCGTMINCGKCGCRVPVEDRRVLICVCKQHPCICGHSNWHKYTIYEVVGATKRKNDIPMLKSLFGPDYQNKIQLTTNNNNKKQKKKNINRQYKQHCHIMEWCYQPKEERII